jgi:hypothetical protein
VVIFSDFDHTRPNGGSPGQIFTTFSALMCSFYNTLKSINWWVTVLQSPAEDRIQIKGLKGLKKTGPRVAVLKKKRTPE